MRIKTILALLVSALLVAGSFYSVHNICVHNSDSFIEANIEALVDEEEPVLSNLHMYIWWVTEYYGGSAITCTPGGWSPCK